MVLNFNLFFLIIIIDKIYYTLALHDYENYDSHNDSMEVENQYSSYEVAENKDPNYGDFLGSPDQDPSGYRRSNLLHRDVYSPNHTQPRNTPKPSRPHQTPTWPKYDNDHWKTDKKLLQNIPNNAREVIQMAQNAKIIAKNIDKKINIESKKEVSNVNVNQKGKNTIKQLQNNNNRLRSDLQNGGRKLTIRIIITPKAQNVRKVTRMITPNTKQLIIKPNDKTRSFIGQNNGKNKKIYVVRITTPSAPNFNIATRSKGRHLKVLERDRNMPELGTNETKVPDTRRTKRKRQKIWKRVTYGAIESAMGYKPTDEMAEFEQAFEAPGQFQIPGEGYSREREDNKDEYEDARSLKLADKRQRKQLGARKQWDDYEEYAGSGGPGGPIGPGPMIPEAAMGPGPGPGGGGYGRPGPGRSGFGPGGPPGYRPPGPPDYGNGPPLGMGQYGPGNGPNMGGPGPGYGPYQGGPPGPRYGPGPGQMGQGGPGRGIPDYANGPMGPRAGPMGLPPGGPMGPMQGGPVGPMQGGPMVPPPGPDYQRVHPEIRYNYGDPNNDPNGPSPQFIPRSPPNRPGMARQGPSFNPGNYGQPPGSSGPGYDYGEGPTPDHGYTPGEPQLQYTDLYGPDANRQNIGPEYGQGGPQYGPGGPQYNPGGSQYGPGEPQYGTDGPQYGPGGPQYGPGGPQYGPGGPQYGPGEPQDQSIYRVSPPGYGPPPGLGGGQFNQHSPPGYGPGPDHNQHKNPGKPGPQNYGSGGPYGGNLANPYTTPKKPPASKRGAKTTTKAVARNKAAKNVTQSKKPIKVKEKPTPPKPFTTTTTSASIKYKTTTVDPDVTEDPFEEYKDYDPLGTTKGFEGVDSKTTRERQTETPSTRSEAERLSSLVDSFDLHPKFAFINDYHKMKKEKKLGIFTNFVVHVMDILAKKDIDFVDRILMSFTNVYEKYYNNGELSALGEPAGRMAMDYLWDITIHYQEDPRDVFKVLFTAVSDRMAYLPDDVNIYLTFLDSLFTHDDEQDILDVVHSLYEYPNNPKITCDIITENMINKVYVHKVKQLAGTPKINILTVSLNTMLTNRFGGNIKITTQKVPKKYRRMNYETTVRVRTTSNPIILQNATSFSLYTYLKNITLHSNLTSNSTSTSNSNATSNSSSTPNSALTSNSTSKLNSTLTSNSTSTSNSSSNSTSCTWPQQKQILTSAINNTVDRLGNNFKFVLKVNNTRKELLEPNDDDFDEGSSSGLDLAAALTGTRRLLEPRRSRHHRTKQRAHRYRPRNRHKHTHQHRNTQKHHKHEHTKSQNHERKRPNIHKQVRDKIHKYEKLMERLERGTREAHLKPDPYSVISKEDLRHHHRKKHHSKRRHKRRNRHHGRKHRNWRREVKGAKLSKLDLSESEDASSEPEMFGTKRFSVVPKHDKPDETPPPKPAEPPKAQRYKFMNPALRRPANLGKKPENPESLKEAKREGSYKQGIYVKPVKPPDNKSNEDSLLDLDNDDDASASASTFNQKNDARKMGIKLKRRRRRAAGFTTTTSAEKIRYPIDENRYNVIKLNDLKVSKKTNASAALKYIKRNILRKIKQLSKGLVANFKKLAKNLSVPSNESDEYQIGKSNMFKALGNLNYLTDITNLPATVSITPVNLYPD